MQTLTANQLRENVVLRVDGGMRSGRDVLVAAALGGDEFGFGTVAMIATGQCSAMPFPDGCCTSGCTFPTYACVPPMRGGPGLLRALYHQCTTCMLKAKSHQPTSVEKRQLQPRGEVTRGWVQDASWRVCATPTTARWG